MNDTKTIQTIPEIWDSVVRRIGGLKIKTFSMSVSGNNNFADTKDFVTTIFSDAIVLKNSTNIIFCDYTVRNRSTLWKCPLENIDKICAFHNGNEHIILLHCTDDGLFWKLNITT